MICHRFLFSHCDTSKFYVSNSIIAKKKFHGSTLNCSVNMLDVEIQPRLITGASMNQMTAASDINEGQFNFSPPYVSMLYEN